MENDDEILDVDAEASTHMDEITDESQFLAAASDAPADQLERCGRWLSSIPRDDVIVLRQTPEYLDFLRAFERLGHCHRRVVSMNRSSATMEDASDIAQQYNMAPLETASSNNFLQHLTADDVVLRIFEFLECHSLIRTALTCSRFRQLAYRSATQRTYDVSNARQLNSVMQLLRAKEQIDGVGTGINDSHVRVPILLLSRRVLVTNAGDPEYNGVYFCTGSNGNGFVFTKPRFPERRVQRASRSGQAGNPLSLVGIHPFPRHHQAVNLEEPDGDVQLGLPPGIIAPVATEGGPAARFESEVTQPGQLLRCIIAKRFSNEVSLVYFIPFQV